MLQLAEPRQLIPRAEVVDALNERVKIIMSIKDEGPMVRMMMMIGTERGWMCSYLDHTGRNRPFKSFPIYHEYFLI